MIAIVSFNLTALVACKSVSDEKSGLSLKECGIIMANEVLSEKLNTKFNADINKELYDFTDKFNYLLCYDKELDYYAIYNMDSGRIMERSNGNVYDGILDYKCYYGGYGSYFYESDNNLYSTESKWLVSIDDAMTSFNHYSEDLMLASIEDSEYKSREEIKSYVERELSQDTVRITLCGKENRENLHYVDDFQYSSLVLANNLYVNSAQVLLGNKYCNIDADDKLYTMGFVEFDKYDGGTCYDTLYPLNINDSCGIVAATMLLQYYERNGILKTIPDELYNRATKLLLNGFTYNRTSILTEIVHDEIDSRHKKVLDGSTYTSVKNALNKFFSDFGIAGVSATSSALGAGIKSAIDNDDPCIVFFGIATLYSLKNDLSGYEDYVVTKHAMYTYGYTTTDSGAVDEYACHTGWPSTTRFNSITYISKATVAGNVRLLY